MPPPADTMSLFGLDMTKTAYLSPCQAFRYHLGRKWYDTERTAAGSVLFVMLNPSTADDKLDDPTIRRCVWFARDWGYSSLDVVNLFALRATFPRQLYKHAGPSGGEENDKVISLCAEAASLIVAGWGVHGSHRGRDKEVLKLLRAARPVHCLGVTKDGHPRHPLYIPNETRPQLYRLPGD